VIDLTGQVRTSLAPESGGVAVAAIEPSTMRTPCVCTGTPWAADRRHLDHRIYTP